MPTRPVPPLLVLPALTASLPLLDHLAPILAHRIVDTTPPTWMQPPTAHFLRLLSDDDLHTLEQAPHLSPSLPLPPQLSHLHNLATPLVDAFPYAASVLNSPKAGASARRSKTRLTASKRLQIRAVAHALTHAIQKSSRPVARVLDFGAGHGHLSAHLADNLPEILNVVALERNETLVRTGQSLHAQSSPTLSFDCTQISPILSGQAASPVSKADALVGLHACGALGDALITHAVQRDASVVVLLSCCLQKLDKLSTHRRPLSTFVRKQPELRQFLTIPRHTLGATNSTRGYTKRGNLVARETRHALRLLLERAGHPVARVGDEVDGLSRHKLRAGLSAVAEDACRLHGLASRVSDHEIALCEAMAKHQYRVMRALALPRASAAAMLEMAVVLDRAACLEEAGFQVSTCRLWRDDVSARNLCIVAWK